MKILIVGYGRTGKALENFCITHQLEYQIYDDNIKRKDILDYAKLKQKKELFDLGILSPGFKWGSSSYRLNKILCKKLISEIDFAYSYLKTSHLIGVTGSNGKTTLVTFLAHLLSSKFTTYTAGNIGTPLIELVDKVRSEDYVIIELSSYQIEESKSLHLETLFFTTFTPNHLDNYIDVDLYESSKKRAYFFADSIYCLSKDNPYNLPKMKAEKVKIPSHIVGKYNKEYARASYTFARQIGIDKKLLLPSIQTLKMVKYRLQIIKKKPFLIINDSKSTSSAATKYAVECFKNHSIILIIGGIHKSSSFECLKKYKINEIYIYGKDREKIQKEIHGFCYETLEEILQVLSNKQIDCLLFSPGCDSHDQYLNYIDRGNKFNQLITKIWRSHE